jgi:hypothetical protein
MRNNKKKPMLLDDTKSSFVCKFCQRVYYQVDLKEFNSDPKKTVGDANQYYKHYHSCRIKDRIAKRTAGRN